MFNLVHYRFRLHFRALQPILKHGYQGSAFRGVFGHAFKKIGCPFKEPQCLACLLRESCHYLKLFETPHSDKRSSNGTTHLPHPFILIPPLQNPLNVAQGEIFFLELVLLEVALPALPYILLAFDKSGQIGMGQGKYFYTLDYVEGLHIDQWHTIFHASQGQLNKTFSPCTLSFPQTFPSSIQLSTCTPLRIKQGGQYLSELPFSVLMRRILRRLDDLSRLYGDGGLAICIQDVLRQAETITSIASDLNWVEFRRYSNRQRQSLHLGGLEGRISYKGELAPFIPWLIWGEALHIGQATSFGFGKYYLSDVHNVRYGEHTHDK